jgi:hypothetical protein
VHDHVPHRLIRLAYALVTWSAVGFVLGLTSGATFGVIVATIGGVLQRQWASFLPTVLWVAVATAASRPHV